MERWNVLEREREKNGCQIYRSANISSTAIPMLLFQCCYSDAVIAWRVNQLQTGRQNRGTVPEPHTAHLHRVMQTACRQTVTVLDCWCDVTSLTNKIKCRHSILNTCRIKLNIERNWRIKNIDMSNIFPDIVYNQI